MSFFGEKIGYKIDIQNEMRAPERNRRMLVENTPDL